MDPILELPEHLQQLQAAVRRLAQEEIAPRAAEIDRLGQFPRDVERLFWDLGLLTLILPETQGGLPE